MTRINRIEGGGVYEDLTGMTVDERHYSDYSSGRSVQLARGSSVAGRDVSSWSSLRIDLKHVVALRNYLNEVIHVEGLE